jgi:ribosome-binding protein aMBF1 (putative translation factor)
MTHAYGPYTDLGQRARQARIALGWSRDKLARMIVERRTLDVTLTGARIMVRELENEGLAMNADVLRYLVALLAIRPPAGGYDQ